MNDAEVLHNKFRNVVEQWIPVRQRTIDNIKKAIENLEVHQRNVNFSRIVGSTASIIGSTMATVSLGVAPHTFSMFSGISFPGIALAAVGGGIAVGASIVNSVLQLSNVKHAQEQLAHDYDQLDTVSAFGKATENEIDGLRKQSPNTSQFVAVFGKILTQAFFRAGILRMEAVTASIGGTAIVGTLLLTAVDLAEIVRSGTSLGSQTETMKQLTDLVEELKTQKQAVAALLE